MKTFKRIALVIVLLIVVALVVVYFKLNAIVKSAVESQASSSLNVPTTLGSADISLLSGHIGLNDLNIGSPKGFTAPQMFSLGGVQVNTSLSELRQTPLKVSEIVIDKPRLVIEQKDLKTNIQALMDQLPKSDTPVTDASGKQSEPIKLIIGTLQLNNAQVVIRPGIPGVEKGEITIPIPSVTLKDIGNSDGNKNGAAVQEVVGKAMQGLVQAASESKDIPEPVRMILKGNVGDLAKGVGDALKKQAGDITSGLKKSVGSELGKVLGGNDGKTPTTKSSKDNPVEGIKDLFGGKKK